MKILELRIGEMDNADKNGYDMVYTLSIPIEDIFPKVLDIAQELLKKVFEPEGTVEGTHEI